MNTLRDLWLSVAVNNEGGVSPLAHIFFKFFDRRDSDRRPLTGIGATDYEWQFSAFKTCILNEISMQWRTKKLLVKYNFSLVDLVKIQRSAWII